MLLDIELDFFIITTFKLQFMNT